LRQQLGTGSPNTVTRMLEAWRGTLAQRLTDVLTLPEVPAEVGEAAVALWRVALTHAGEHAQAEWTQAHDELAAARSALAEDRAAWGARLQDADTARTQAQAAQALAEHACATLDSQLADSHALRADLLQQRDRLQEQCDARLQEVTGLRAQLEAAQTTQQEERLQQAAYLRGVEDRAHQEIDRARQDAKQWQQRYEGTERAQREALSALQAQREGLLDQLRTLEQAAAAHAGHVAGLEKALANARPIPSRAKTRKARAGTGAGRRRKNDPAAT
jgi:chromosome segregation ATPase